MNQTLAWPIIILGKGYTKIVNSKKLIKSTNSKKNTINKIPKKQNKNNKKDNKNENYDKAEDNANKVEAGARNKNLHVNGNRSHYKILQLNGSNADFCSKLTELQTTINTCKSEIIIISEANAEVE